MCTRLDKASCQATTEISAPLLWMATYKLIVIFISLSVVYSIRQRYRKHCLMAILADLRQGTAHNPSILCSEATPPLQGIIPASASFLPYLYNWHFCHYGYAFMDCDLSLTLVVHRERGSPMLMMCLLALFIS